MERGFSKFGSYLREARRRRALTLEQVASASEGFGLDASARISRPYLGLVESGRATRLSLPKVLTLSAIYLVAPDTVIGHAPPSHRRTLLVELEQWRADGRPIPRFVRYLPQLREPAERAVDLAAQARAESVRVPLGDDAVYRATIRTGLTWAALPAFLGKSEPPLIRRFWIERPQSAGEADRRQPARLWHAVAHDFHDWLLYEQNAGPQLVSFISRWTIDFGQGKAAGLEPFTCHFTDPRIEQVFGFERVPVLLVHGYHWRWTARLLGRSAPSALGLPPAPANPLDAMLDYVAALTLPGAGPALNPAPDARQEVTALVTRLASALPDWFGHPNYPARADCQAIIDFFNGLTTGRRREIKPAGSHDGSDAPGDPATK